MPRVQPPCWEGRDDPRPFVPGLPERITRARTLAGLFTAMRCCTRCELAPGRSRVVVGAGPAPAELMFVGEAPGAQEDARGEPFVGGAGRYFNTLLEQSGIVRAEVFVTNVVACRPPGNRTPRAREITAHAPWLEAQIRLVQPRVIATLGRAALTYFLPKGKVTELSGQPLPLVWQDRERLLVPLFHPAAALRARDLRPRLEAGFAAVRAALASAPGGSLPAGRLRRGRRR